MLFASSISVSHGGIDCIMMLTDQAHQPPVVNVALGIGECARRTPRLPPNPQTSKIGQWRSGQSSMAGAGPCPAEIPAKVACEACLTPRRFSIDLSRGLDRACMSLPADAPL